MSSDQPLALTMDQVMHSVVRDYFRDRGLTKTLHIFDSAMKSRIGRESSAGDPIDVASLFNQRLPASVNANRLENLCKVLMSSGVPTTKLKPAKKGRSKSHKQQPVDDGWSDVEVKKLKKACKKYPSGKTSEEDAHRWDKVAKAIGGSHTAAECKAKHRALKKARSKGGSGSKNDANRGLMTTGPMDMASAMHEIHEMEDDGEDLIVMDSSDDEPSASSAKRHSRHNSGKKIHKTSQPKKDAFGGFEEEENAEAATTVESVTPKKEKKGRKKDKKKHDRRKSGGSGGSSKKKHPKASSEHKTSDAPSAGGFFGGDGSSPTSAKARASVNDADELDEVDLSGDEELEALGEIGVMPVSASAAGSKGSTGLSSKDKKVLHSLIFGNTVPYKNKTYFNSAWLRQGFSFSDHKDLKYGVVQNEGGPCGPLSCVQAHVLLHLMAHHHIKGDDMSSKVDGAVLAESVTAALSTILWRAATANGDNSKPCAVVALPENPKSKGDPLVEGLVLQTFTQKQDLHTFLGNKKVQKLYGAPRGPGVALFVCSLALSRGLRAIKDDFDTAEGFGDSAFMTSHFYASQLLVNLCLVGRAVANVFNGEQTRDNFLLRGIPKRSDIGFLTLFEHHDYVRVGSNYKLPRYPIWVVCSESHYSTFFAAQGSSTPLSKQLDGTFDLLYFDGLDGQDERICLTVKCDGEGHNVELEREGGDSSLIPPLNHCLRTCWPNSSIHWNGSEPRL